MLAWFRIRFANRIVFLAVAAVTCFAPAVASALDQIPWVGSVRQAQQIAKARGRLVLLHFRGNNCPPCDRMDNEIFTQAGVARAIAINYVPVKINVDESPELKTHYKVSQWPTEIVLAPDGKEVKRWVGAPKSDDAYISHLDGIAANFRVYQHGGQAELADAGSRESSDRDEREGRSGDANSPYRQVQYNQQSNPQNNQDASRSASSAQSYSSSLPPRGEAQAYSQNRWRQSEPGDPADPARHDYRSDGANRAASDDPASRYAPPTAYTSRQSQFAPQGRPEYETTSAGGASNGASGGLAEAGDSEIGAREQASAVEPERQQEQFNPYSRPDVRVAQAPSEDYSANQFPANQYPAGQSSAGQYPSGSSTANPYQPSQPQAGQPQAGSYQSNPYQASSPQQAGAAYGAPANGAAQSPAIAVAPPPLAMDGFCPVTLCERQEWIKGDRRYGAIHRGRTYTFTTQQAQAEFLQNPDRYSPVLSGCDVVRFIDGGEFVDGLRKYGIFVGEHVFLFADEGSLDAFEKNPRHYAQAAWRAMQEGGATLR
jgi:YHS domain-containing protein/thiol-disulfide isomerase/thioredoxin